MQKSIPLDYTYLVQKDMSNIVFAVKLTPLIQPVVLKILIDRSRTLLQVLLTCGEFPVFV